MGAQLTVKSVRARPVVVPLKRPVVSKVGLFKEWPIILIDLYTHEGVVGHSYLEPYLKNSARYIIPAIEDLATAVTWQDWADPILAEPFELKDGHLIVPDRPGQGIAWNEKAVAKFAP